MTVRKSLMTLLMSPYLCGRWSIAFTIQANNYINHTRDYWVLIPEFVLAVVLNSPKNLPTFPLSGLNLVLWNKVLPEKPRFSLLLKKSAACALINGSHLCSQKPANDPDHETDRSRQQFSLSLLRRLLFLWSCLKPGISVCHFHSNIFNSNSTSTSYFSHVYCMFHQSHPNRFHTTVTFKED
jgi:hypothetical protein